jgi:hypothetical protein
MKFKFKCQCGKILVADSAAAGKKAKCSQCGQILRVPQPPDAATSAISSTATKPAPAKSVDASDDLTMLPLDDLPPTAKLGAATGKPVAESANVFALKGKLSIDSKTAKPTSPGNKTIWNEMDEDDYGLKADASQPCPNCGKSMSAQAVLCVACGYNRKTGVLVQATSSRPTTKSEDTSSPRWRLGFPAFRLNRYLLRGAIFAFVIGVPLLLSGFKEKKLSDASSTAPETMSLEKLVQRGPEGNPNINLTGFLLCNNFVYVYPKNDLLNQRTWNGVWVPIIVRPADVRPGTIAHLQGAGVQALIYSKNVRTKEGLIPHLGVEQLSGMVINSIETLSTDKKQLLEKSYPNINFDRCIIFEEGRKPADAESISLRTDGGCALIFIGICCLGAGFIWQ